MDLYSLKLALTLNQDTPRPIDTPGVDTFNGKVLRSQRYDENVDITVRIRACECAI